MEEAYSVRREHYEATRKELEQARKEYFSERDRDKRAELVEKLRNLMPPHRPEAVYRVSFVGEDYLAASRDGYEVLVPLSSIRDLRRTADAPGS